MLIGRHFQRVPTTHAFVEKQVTGYLTMFDKSLKGFLNAILHMCLTTMQLPI